MIDVSQPGSPGWWLDRLAKKLADRQPRLNRLDAYYKGEADLPESAESARDAYRAFQRKARANFAELVIEAVRERMVPVGFRTGAQNTEETDSDAWGIWQANSLDADSMLAHRAMLVMGDAYAIVGAPDEASGQPVISLEDPRQVITEHDPVRRRQVVAAAKLYVDDVAGMDMALLYLPGFVFKAFRRRKTGVSAASGIAGWDWVDGTPEVLPFDQVPVVRFPNRADLFSETSGEFEAALDTLDRINHGILQRLIIATIQAFRQRAVMGVQPNDEAGNPIDFNGLFMPGPAALWMLPEDAKMWESSQTDLTGILLSVRNDIMDLAASTRTPLFYLTPDAANGSAEGASLAREGLVFKVNDRIVQAGEAWEQVMSLAFRWLGDNERANTADLEVLWAPPERFSLAERYDAASKAQAAGVPWRYVMTDVLQFSPSVVDRMSAERVADAMLTASLAPAPPAPAATAAPPAPPAPQGTPAPVAGGG